jgi:hypothetical protein
MAALALASRPTLEVELKNHLANPSFRLREITRFADDGGFRSMLVVRSGGFSVDRPFFFDGSALARFLDELGGLEELRPGFARLRASDGPDVLGFELHARGEVTVFGAIHEQTRVTQSLRYAFTTDQTVIGPFRDDLSRAWSLPSF